MVIKHAFSSIFKRSDYALKKSGCGWFTSVRLDCRLVPYRFTRRRNQLRPDFSGPILLFTPSVLYLAVHAPLIRTGVLLGLQSGWLSETIRTGDGHGSLPLDSVPHSICKAFHLWWSWGLCGVGERPRERQQGNRLCNVFGRVFFFCS